MTDPIADMLTRVRNASMVKKSDVLVPFSKIKFEIAKILVKEQYLKGVEIIEDPYKTLKIALKYEDKKSVISNITRVSKVGRRIYVNSDKISRVLNGYGLSIISTSKGIMTNREARKAGVGGEVLCEIY